MPDAVPLDQHHRERIRTAHHETLFVEAGAGTGKTTALIGRLVELAGAGVPLSSVAAITFTEAAAAELRDRLRYELDRRLADDPGNEAWARALEELDGAAIQTLHGFAQRLLSLYPLEAGLPPGFTVRDDPAARAAFDERFDQFLDEFLGEDGPAELVEMLEGFGCMRKVREIAWALHGSWDRVSRPSGPLMEPPRLPRRGPRNALRSRNFHRA
ncbi:MAG: UvrD-helicase domain-containing protein [Dehalococcoidia bacterium]|nr:UvrD-helicase domain-containing protein [Dehalococcoidia bacterium]